MNAKEARKKYVDTCKAYKGVAQGSERHKKIIDVFNRIKPDGWAMTYNAYWCATFASATAQVAFGDKVAKKYFPLSANCVTIITKAKRMGIWKENDRHKPLAGDWVLYDWQDSGYGDNVGSPDHVGVITSVSDGVMHVIEGNKNRAVGMRDVMVGGRFIRGFVVPKYGDLAKALTPKKKTAKPSKKGSANKPKEPVKKPAAKKQKTAKESNTHYTVRRGDTLTSIAKRFGTTWQKLQKLNGIKNANMIKVGQRLKVK